MGAGAKIWGSLTSKGDSWRPITANQYITPVNTGVNVTVASTTILALNADRLYALIVNESDEDMWLGIGVAAVAHIGIWLKAGGGFYEITWINLYTGVINGIHAGAGNKIVTVMEGD